MIKKTFYLSALLLVLLALANLGAGFFFLLVIAIFPLQLEQSGKKLKLYYASNKSLLELPRILQKILLLHFKRGEFDQLEEIHRQRIRKIAGIVFLFSGLFLAIYNLGIILTILQGKLTFTIASAPASVLYLLCYLILLSAVKYEKRLLQNESYSEADLNHESGRLSYLYLHIFFSFFMVLLSMAAFATGDEQAVTPYLSQIKDSLIYLVTVLLAFFNAEALFKILREFPQIFSFKPYQPENPNLILIEAMFGKATIKSSIESFFSDLLGLDLKKSELFKFFLNIFEPVFIFSLLLVWLLTSLVIIGPNQVGIVYRFGQINEADSCSPGLVFKMPWPLGQYRLEEKNRIRMVNIGFEPDSNARHIIWTKSHATENFNLIVGDGLEMISIDCQIMFRLKNVRNYLLSYQNPEELVKALAYRFLTFAAVSSSFDELMDTDRSILAEKLKTEIQTELDQRQSGIDIVKVVFLAMHPPIEVADVFENVISAQLDRLTFTMYAETESVHNRFMHQAFAAGEIHAAQGNAFTAVAEASGQSQAFVSQALGFNYAPELAKFRLRLESLQKLVENKKLYVIDRSLFRPTDRLLLRVTE